MSKLKIALYTRSFPPKSGGVSTAHYNIYNLLKDKYEVMMFVYDETENSTSNTVVKRKTIPWVNNLLIFTLKWKYRKAKKKISFTNVSKIINTFIPVLKMNKILKKFQPDFIIVPDNFVPAYLLKTPKKSKLILFAHHNYRRFSNQPLLEQQDWLDLQIAYSMECKAMQKVDAVISPSEYMIKRFKDATYDKKSLFCIHNFMEDAVFNSIKEEAEKQNVLPFDKKIIYIPSAGSDIKGKRYVFEIIRRLSYNHKDIFFYLSGNLPSDLKYELKPYKKYIYAPGHVSWEDNLKNVMNCNFGITPNLEENFSYAILEGQASGLPFVTFDTGGNKEIVLDNQTGFVIPFLDIEALIEKACILLQDLSLLKSFKINAAKECYKRFNSESILYQYDQVLKEINEL